MSYFSYTYSTTAYGGLIFPWGYVVQNIFTHLSAGPFKGPYTMVFSPSAIDTTFFGITKIVYDFDDGSDLLIIEKDIIPNLVGSFQWDGNPGSLNIPHDYYPLNDNITTYNPTVTVVNGNLVQNIYSITFSFVPASLYEYESLRLINAIQLNNKPEESLTIFELSNPNYVTNVRIISSIDNQYTLPYEKEPDEMPGLILWLDAADASTIDKDTYNKVSVWRDKSGNDNHFTQVSASNRPTFVYEPETTTNRKSVKFTANNIVNDPNAKFLECINTTAFDVITGGYTAFFVISPKKQEGTVLSQNGTVPLNLPGSCIPPDPDIHTVVFSYDSGVPGPAGYTRQTACYRCLDITVDSAGNITSYEQSGSTTNGRNLVLDIINNNLVPTVAGSYTFIFEFYGWRKWNPQSWISADDKFDILTDFITATVLP